MHLLFSILLALWCIVGFFAFIVSPTSKSSAKNARQVFFAGPVIWVCLVVLWLALVLIKLMKPRA